MSQSSAHAIANADAQATTSTSSLRSDNARGASWTSATHVNKNAFVGFNLGVPASPLEPMTSMDPKDYVWGTPSQQQQQNLFQQFMQMAFFWQMTQNAGLPNGNQGQQQPLPMLPFPFTPMGPMNSFPFNPVMPSFPGFTPGASNAPSAANVQPQTAPQSAAASVVSMPSSSVPLPTAKSSVPVQQPTSAAHLDPAISRPVSDSDAVAAALDLDDAPHDCDAIECLLADADLFAGNQEMNDCSSYDHVGSPCSLSGSDGSTATADAFFQGSDSDSPASVTGDQALYHPSDLALSDAELDAVMLGLANNSNFTDLDMDDYAFISLDAPSASATTKPIPTTKAAKQGTKEKAVRKRKAATSKPPAAAKGEKRSKVQPKPAIAAAVVEQTTGAITEILGPKMH